MYATVGIELGLARARKGNAANGYDAICDGIWIGLYMNRKGGVN